MIISIIAIFISVGSLIWNISIYVKNERRKLKIHIYPDYDEDPKYMFDEGYNPTKIFVIEVTNMSKQTIRYYSPFLEYYDGKIQELENKRSSDNVVSYGDVNSHVYLREHFLNEMDIVNFDIDIFKCVVQDTLGKRYESNQIINEKQTKVVVVQ